MRDAITSLDLRALVRELEVLEGARVDKVYQRDRELTIHAYKPGDKKYRLFLAPGKVFLTDYKRDNPQNPPSFCMFLRKYLAGKTINSVEQYGFDRVLMLEIEDKQLVVEVFGQGNVVLVDKESGEINGAMESQEWDSRSIYRGEVYQPPQPGNDPTTLTIKGFRDVMSSKQIVKVLAADLGLGSVYAEEVMARSDIQKDARSDGLSTAQQEHVFETIQSFITEVTAGAMEPRIYYDGDDPADVSPVPLQQYNGYETKQFETFSRALDTYFTEQQKAAYRKQKLEAYRQKKQKLERMKEQQEQMLQGMEDAIDEKKEIGDLIYRNYGTVEEVVETLRKIRKQFSEQEILDRLESEQANGVRTAQVIEDINLAEGYAVVDLGPESVRIEIDEGVEKNAERYYKKSKEAKRKFEGAKDALKKTKQKLERLEANKEDIDVRDAFTNKEEKRRSKKWYEKFRWCFSSDGFLIVGGRDATSNEMLVKKQMHDNDTYVHADFEGAPSVVIKNEEGNDVPEQTLQEAGQMAITFSKAWKLKIGAEDAYHVSPDQVTKNPESGEYLGKGAFIIRGDRTYMKNLKTSAAVGLYKRGDEHLPMGGPLSAVKKHCDRFVEVAPGSNKKSDVAKQVKRHLEHDDIHIELDTVIRALPPGKCRIKSKH